MPDDKARLRLAAYLVTGIWFVALLVTGAHLSGVWTKIVTSAPLIVLIVFAICDNWLWQVRGVRRLTRRPLIAGTWYGELVSLRSDSTGVETTHPPIPIVLVIRQTYLALSLTMLSAESKSRSIGALLQRNDSDDFTVFYHYDNVPTLEYRGASARHAGGSRVDVAGLSPKTLTGEYWTDRRTRGHFELRKVSKKRYGSWADASAALDKQGDTG
jgi:SMODS-associating 2TM, beta-strand rich effector domain